MTLLTNVRPWGGPTADLLLADGRIAEVRAPGGEPEALVERIDGRGLLALPGFVNAHAHIDKSWWGLGEGWVSYGGEATTQGRIAHERAERDALGIPSVAATDRVLRAMIASGTTAIRTHVDVDLGVGLRGIETVRAAVADLGVPLGLEIVAFPQDGVLRRPGVLELLEQAARAGADHVGGIDPASLDRDPVRQIEGIVAIAERHGVGIDLHLHDGGELGAFQIELLADRVRRAGIGGPGRVTVSHGFALGDLAVDAGRQRALVAELAETGIGWSTVAPVRTAPLPWRAMLEQGVGLGLGTDGIRDLWSPYGDGDLLKIALGFARLHGLRTDDDLTTAVRLASSAAAAYVGREVHDLAPGAVADLVLLDAVNVPDALIRTPQRALVIAQGVVVARDGEVV